MVRNLRELSLHTIGVSVSFMGPTVSQHVQTVEGLIELIGLIKTPLYIQGSEHHCFADYVRHVEHFRG